jgi:non-ribosomal peptide synthetase component F
VSRVEVLSAAERDLIVAGWNDTAADVPAGTLPGLFAAQAAASPGAVAVAEGGAVLSYAELDERSSRVASALIAAGVRAEDRVGVYMRRSVGLVAALLGVMKAGGAYVPLDPEYPAERVRFMVED